VPTLPNINRALLRHLLSIDGYGRLEAEVNALEARYSRVPWLVKQPVVLIDHDLEPGLFRALTPMGVRSVRRCSCCGELMLSTSDRQIGPERCDGCLKAEQRDRKRRWRSETPNVIESRSCVVCGTVFTPKRSDAKCCSGKCRTKLSRQEARG
jgi:predicted nucleic acid-binding Zn ribbon protein